MKCCVGGAVTCARWNNVLKGGEIGKGRVAGWAAANKAQGTPTEPAAVNVGTPFAGTVGIVGHNQTSFYEFTTGTSTIYQVGVGSVTGDSDELSFTGGSRLSGDFRYLQGSSSRGPRVMVLKPSTQYFLEVKEENYNELSWENQAQFQLLVKPTSAPAGTSLSLDTTLQPNFEAYQEQWYDVVVPGPGDYVVTWKDRFSQEVGDDFTLDIAVSAYSEDYSTAFFDAWQQGPATVTVTGAGAHTVRLFVEAQGTVGGGTFELTFHSPD